MNNNRDCFHKSNCYKFCNKENWSLLFEKYRWQSQKNIKARVVIYFTWHYTDCWMTTYALLKFPAHTNSEFDKKDNSKKNGITKDLNFADEYCKRKMLFTSLFFIFKSMQRSQIFLLVNSIVRSIRLMNIQQFFMTLFW